MTYIIAHNASPIMGGGEIWLGRLLVGLERRGHRVLLLCRNSRVATEAGEYGIRTRVHVLGGDLMLPHAIGFARMLEREAPDVLLLTTFKKSWLGGLAARIAGVPRVLLRVGRMPDRPHGITYRIALRHWVDKIVLNAEAMRVPLVAALPKLPDGRVVAVHDGIVEPERLQPAGAVRRSLGIPGAARVIGAIARLSRQKRLDRLLRAFAELPADVHCIIAGTGAEREALTVLAAELGLERRMHMLGFRGDIGDVLDALDVFVVTSDFEGMANAMLEAMAAGVPVVSTRVSGAEEALHPFADAGERPGDICGFEAAEIADAIARILNDAELARNMGDAGIRRVKEAFTFERMLDEWEALLLPQGDALPSYR